MMADKDKGDELTATGLDDAQATTPAHKAPEAEEGPREGVHVDSNGTAWESSEASRADNA